MREAQAGVERGVGAAEGARSVLEHAARRTRDVAGSSTAVVAVMRGPATAEITCLGDSGFRLHRQGRCVFASDVRALLHRLRCSA